jgi:hypothetical protein
MITQNGEKEGNFNSPRNFGDGRTQREKFDSIVASIAANTETV